MNAPVSIPAPTLDDLISRAIEDHDAVGKIALTPHLQPKDEEVIAAKAVADAMDDWLWDTQTAATNVVTPLVAVAFRRVLAMGRDARDAADQFDLFANAPMTDGAARHEARGELG